MEAFRLLNISCRDSSRLIAVKSFQFCRYINDGLITICLCKHSCSLMLTETHLLFATGITHQTIMPPHVNSEPVIKTRPATIWPHLRAFVPPDWNEQLHNNCHFHIWWQCGPRDYKEQNVLFSFLLLSCTF